MITAFVMAIILISTLLAFILLLTARTVPDRIVAANAIGIMLFSVILLYSFARAAIEILDVALVYAILQFADVLIMAKYLDRKDLS